MEWPIKYVFVKINECKSILNYFYGEYFEIKKFIYVC